MDHHLNALHAAKGTTLPKEHQASIASASSCRKLGAGKAVTLRAKRLETGFACVGPACQLNG